MESSKTEEEACEADSEHDTRQKRKAFANVRKQMETLTFKEIQSLRGDIKISTLNIGGLRSKYKKESLKALAFRLKFSIGVTTETHLLDWETEALTIPGYTIVNKMGKSRNRGGVLIMVDADTVFRKTADAPKLPSAVDACAAELPASPPC